MQIARSLFFASSIFVFILLLLAFLPNASWQIPDDAQAVYYTKEEFGDQLVNLLVNEALALRIKRVESDTESLIIDFIATDSRPDLETIYTDLRKIIFSGFEQLSTLIDIRARIIVNSGNEDKLLIGVLARRDQHQPHKLKGNSPIDTVVHYINHHFRVTYGSAWYE